MRSPGEQSAVVSYPHVFVSPRARSFLGACILRNIREIGARFIRAKSLTSLDTRMHRALIVSFNQLTRNYDGIANTRLRCKRRTFSPIPTLHTYVKYFAKMLVNVLGIIKAFGKLINFYAPLSMSPR